MHEQYVHNRIPNLLHHEHQPRAAVMQHVKNGSNGGANPKEVIPMDEKEEDSFKTLRDF